MDKKKVNFLIDKDYFDDITFCLFQLQKKGYNDLLIDILDNRKKG